MTFDKYSVYSVVATSENKNEDELLKILEFTENLKKTKDAKEIKELLEKNWKIKNDINNFSIGNNTTISIRTGKIYFNVTLKKGKEVNTYCFNK